MMYGCFSHSPNYALLLFCVFALRSRLLTYEHCLAEVRECRCGKTLCMKNLRRMRYKQPVGLALIRRVLRSQRVVFLDISITLPWVCKPNVGGVDGREVFDGRGEFSYFLFEPRR